MGLLDNLGAIAGQLGGIQNANGTADPKAALVQAVLGMLVHGNEPGGLGGSGGIGGLGGLLQRFQSAGLGDQIASWIGSGANTPISADQIKSALGDGPLRALAEHAGLDEDEAASHLSSLLPQMVDKLTPGGQVPAEGLQESGVAGALDSLSHLFVNKLG
jgi:uncharacterized protein YidB (DUF937 family)